MAEFRRKRNRLGARAYQGRAAYFLTICTEGRRKLLGDSKLVDGLLGVLREKCAVCFFDVYAYCFMPDHLHLILMGQREAADLAAVVKAFKGAGTAVARQKGVRNLWEKSFYDHVLRSGEGIDEAARYVFMNPVRAGLARRMEDWPYSGSLVFEWRSWQVPVGEFVPTWKSGERMERQEQERE